MDFSTGIMKILPSPILPVRAAPVRVAIRSSTAVVADNDLELDFGQEVDRHLSAAVFERDPFLLAASLDFRDGHAYVAFVFKRFFYELKPFGFDNCRYHFHFFHPGEKLSGPLPVLGDVEPDIFFFLTHPQAHRFVYDDRKDIRDDECVDDRCTCTDDLGDELVDIAL